MLFSKLRPVALLSWTTRGKSTTSTPRLVLGRLWRSLEYEAVYPHELSDGFKAEPVIAEWIDFHNTVRPHSALAGRTPAEAHGAGRPVDLMDNASALPTTPPAQQRNRM